MPAPPTPESTPPSRQPGATDDVARTDDAGAPGAARPAGEDEAPEITADDLAAQGVGLYEPPFVADVTHPAEFSEPDDIDPAVGSIPLNLILLAAPMIGAMVSRTVMSFVDFAMVSRLGTEAQAAIMPAGLVLFGMTSVGFGAVGAVSTYVSQSLGRRDHAACGSYGWQGIHLSLVIGLLSLLLIPLVGPFWAMIGHEPAVQEMEAIYTRIGLLGTVFLLMPFALANFFNGIHRPMIGLWANIIANLVNVFLNWVLIFGNLGFEPMGIAGAAWATLIAGALQTFLLIGWFLLPSYELAYRTRTQWRLHRDHLGRILKTGLPIGVQFGVDLAAWSVFTLVLVGTRFGTAQLAANNIAFKFIEVAFMPTIGLGMALSAAVGKCIGEKRWDLARQYVRWNLLFSMVYMVSIAGIMVTFRYPLLELFTEDAEVIRWGARIIILAAIFQIFDAAGITYASALRGAGDTRWPAVAFVLHALVSLMGLGWLIGEIRPDWGSAGTWAAATLYVSGLGVTMALRYLFGPWESFDLHAQDGPTTRRSAAPEA